MPLPQLSDDDILIQVEASVYGPPERTALAERTPGGCGMGLVVDTGERATHLSGKRVLVGPEKGCGECDVCRRASVVSCPHGHHLGTGADGTLASHVVTRARWACVLDGALSEVIDRAGPATALLGREAALAYAMLVRASVAPGEPVVILGHNIIARFLVELALRQGIKPMVLTGRDPAPAPASSAPDQPHADNTWAAWLRQRDAIVVDGTTMDGAAIAKGGAVSGWRGMLRQAAADAGHGERPLYLFETTATDEGRSWASALAGPAAKLIFLAKSAYSNPDPGDAARGLPANMPPSTPANIIDAVCDHDSAILAVAGTHPDLLPEIVALAVRGELDIAGAAALTTPDGIAAAAESLRRDPQRPPRQIVVHDL